jgi:hypothetical protein
VQQAEEEAEGKSYGGRGSHDTRHASHVTRHTSHVTPHTSHVTRHTSHVTRHTSHVARASPSKVLCNGLFHRARDLHQCRCPLSCCSAFLPSGSKRVGAEREEGDARDFAAAQRGVVELMFDVLLLLLLLLLLRDTARHQHVSVFSAQEGTRPGRRLQWHNAPLLLQLLLLLLLPIAFV